MTTTNVLTSIGQAGATPDRQHASANQQARDWQTIDTAPENVVVLTKIHDGKGARNEAPLKRQGRLWWFADGSMYVYYAPTHWSPI